MPVFKPNPGCEIPDPRFFPDVEQFITNIVTSTASKLIPQTGTAAVISRAKEAQETIDNITSEIKDEAKARIDRIDQYLNTPCPLPDVVDKAATGN